MISPTYPFTRNRMLPRLYTPVSRNKRSRPRDGLLLAVYVPLYADDYLHQQKKKNIIYCVRHFFVEERAREES